MKEVCVVKYGGSFLIPEQTYDPEAILFLIDLVKQFPNKRFVFIIGGGGLARKLATVVKSAVQEVLPSNLHDVALDEIGIAATKMNAQVVLQTMSEILGEHVVDQKICIDPTNPLHLKKQVTIAAGARPGHTTDYDMIELAKNSAANRVFKISNFKQVLNVSPLEYKPDTEYKAIKELSWNELRNLVGTKYVVGGHYPLDPRAAVYGQSLAKKDAFQLCIGQKEELVAMIKGDEFIGTIIKN